MIIYMGYVAVFFTVYNIICGMLQRINLRFDIAGQTTIEAAIWFVAASICLK